MVLYLLLGHDQICSLYPSVYGPIISARTWPPSTAYQFATSGSPSTGWPSETPRTSRCDRRYWLSRPPL
jgi:hypothetical protein